MKKRFLKAAAAMMAISLTVTSVGVTAYAEDNQKNLDKNDANWDVNNGNIGTNTGNIGTNTATIDDNYGSIERNEGEVGNNYGTINENTSGENSASQEIGGSAGTTNENTSGENSASQEIGGSAGTTNENTSGENSASQEIGGSAGTTNENTSGENSASQESSGTVDRNFGTINTNSSKASEKPGSQTNYQYGGVDENYGTIWTNTGYVDTNTSIRIYIEGEKKGTEVNESDVDYSADSQKTFHGYIDRNNGIVDENYATIWGNAGTIRDNYGDVYMNSGIINMNGSPAKVWNENELQAEGVEVPYENAVVRENTGEVLENNGIVDNYEGGTVYINNGKVYNYGGSIANHYKDSNDAQYGTGTEYFSVSINKSEGLNTSYTEGGFTYHNGDKWLGETRNKDGDRNRTTSTVTVTPTDGYEISEFVIPDKYKDYVSAKKEDNGTWTLTVKSGCNISLTPTATYIRNTNNSDIINTGDSNDSREENKVAITVDISSDNNDSRNDPAPKSDPANNSAGQVANPDNALPPITLNSVDVANLGISVSVSDVMEKVNNITAMNNFIAAGRTLPSTENIMACGIIDFKNLFTNVETGNVEVPVEATVVAGNTYTVVLSDGTLLAVECTVNGILNIPFATTAQNLTFIIYGTQSNSLAPIG